MSENLQAFRHRTAFVREPMYREGRFITNARLPEKVSGDGSFRPFYGDTVIFDLPADDKAWLSDIQRRLYEACGALLADPLDPSSFHITLHDLNNAVDAASIAPAMERARKASRALLASLPADWAVRVKSTAVFNMVGASVVLGFEPVEESDCAALMGLYAAFQQVVPLNYALTPHVTLAYYRPMDADNAALQLLADALDEANRELSPRVLPLANPQYCVFTDMNHYQPDPA